MGAELPNAFRGECRVDVAGVPLTFAFDYEAQGALRTTLGKEWLERVYAAAQEQDVEVLALAAAAGLRRHHPHLDAAAVAGWSPPPVLLGAAIVRALRVALWGPGVPETDKGAEAGGKPAGGAETRRLLTLCKTLLNWRRAWASAPQTSGPSPRLN